MLFGMVLSDTGVKRYPIRVRPRIIQYAITLMLEKNDMAFIKSLKQKLIKMYPLHQDTMAKPSHREPISYIYYPGEFNLIEFVPMCIAFFLVFIYVYYSVRKIDVFKSRFVLAISAVITVLSSLMMALGLCFFFGLTISMQSRGVLPYLIMLFGLENVLVITKSVVSTDEKYDVKIRIAQGLSKEGWSISKTLLTEITILTIGLITFVPVIQEFCIFAIVGLISDHLMQILLFSTILALNVRRIEYGNLSKASKVPDMAQRVPYRYVTNSASPTSTATATMNRSRSHPKFSTNQEPTDVVATGKTITEIKKIPKRLKIFNFWARTRFFQRAFMLWMTVWIVTIIYNSGVLEQIFVIDNKTRSDVASDSGRESVAAFSSSMPTVEVGTPDNVTFFGDKNTEMPPKNTYFDENQYNLTEQLNRLRHPDMDANVHLSNFHWSSILKQYNISIHGRYVTILPTIRLSHAVEPNEAIHLRNADEKQNLHFQWKALAIALDPIDFADAEDKEEAFSYQLTNTGGYNIGSTPLYPKTPMEMLLATILCVISIFVLTYAMVVFYRCICSRNYAEWRSSWYDSNIDIAPKTQRVFEGIPIQLKSHKHRIECMVSDGRMLASSCLDGKISVWDVSNCEQVNVINRQNYFNVNRRLSGSYTLNGSETSTPITMKTLNSADNCYTKKSEMSAIWCLDYMDNLIVIGCADGKIEFWESTTGALKVTIISELSISILSNQFLFTISQCIYEGDGKNKVGVTHLHLSGDRLVAARLNGKIDFLRLETYNQGRQIDWGFMSAYRRSKISSITHPQF